MEKTTSEELLKNTYELGLSELSWEDYLEKRRNNQINVGIENSIAFKILNSPIINLMSKGRKLAHRFWTIVTGLLFFLGLGSFVSYFFTSITFWYPVGFFVAFYLVGKSTKKSAAQFILEELDENKAFYEYLQELEITTGVKALFVKY